ncbi:MAG: glucokinase [Gallionella sp.]
MEYILTGDIGGTKTRLAVVTVSGTTINIVYEVSYASREYATFEELVADFLSRTKSYAKERQAPHADKDHRLQVEHAALGIAGPVLGGLVLTTNLPWRIDADALVSRFGFNRCSLLNDLEATAYGLPALDDADLHTLQTGDTNALGNGAIIAAGTGLGEAGLFWNGAAYQPFATEGGHTSFSPGSELDIAFLSHLKLQRKHVSWERVVSGMGLLSMHEFLCLHRQTPPPQWLLEEQKNGDAAAAISKAALAESDDICVETMKWFVHLYGAEAGNLALKVMSRGGIYLGGGIAPKILPLLMTGNFVESFLNKGRMRKLLEAVPIKVILNDRAALYGPALFAAQSASD